MPRHGKFYASRRIWQRHLRSGLTRAEMERQASAESDTEAACRMQEAKQHLFAGFRQKQERMKRRRRWK